MNKRNRARWQDPRHVQTAEIDNPEYARAHAGAKGNPERIKATVNLRESAITALAARGQLDKAQAAAAERFRALWEAMGGAGAGSIDYLKEPVDGGGFRDPLSERQAHAGKELSSIRTQLGEYNYRLVGYICGEGYSIHDLTETRRQRDTMTDVLRQQLDILAIRWNFVRPGKQVSDIPLYRCC